MNLVSFTDKAGDRIKFRHPQNGDTDKLLDFFDSLSERSKELFQPHPFDEKSANKIANDKDLIVLATVRSNQPEKIIGYSFIHKIPITGGGNFGIAVTDLYSGRGVGKRLTEEILTLAKRNGYKKIYLTVKTKNKNAIALYQKMGFGSLQNNNLIKSRIQIYELISNFGWFFFLQTAIKALFGKKARKAKSRWMVKNFV